MGDFEGEFAVGVVRGLRCFSVRRNGTVPVGLVGAIHTKYAWRSGENESQCPIMEVPELAGLHRLYHCTCGFYAYHDGSNEFDGSGRITGVIEGYGKTVIGTKGFRASKARIVAFLIPEVTFWDRLYRLGMLGVMLGMLGLVIGGLAIGPLAVSAPWVLLFDIPWVTASVALLLLSFTSIDKHTTGAVGPRVARMLRQQFPNVPRYSSKAEMLAHHPLYSGLEGTSMVESGEDGGTGPS